MRQPFVEAILQKKKRIENRTRVLGHIHNDKRKCLKPTDKRFCRFCPRKDKKLPNNKECEWITHKGKKSNMNKALEMIAKQFPLKFSRCEYLYKDYDCV
ncbi:MAG: hypothetical protein GY714_14215 [Desulfobacterales bacterium]|nr:hypothetical protein [Desulfobacterales bacterium]